jgi:hypothetical protein
MKRYKIVIVENNDDEFTDVKDALSELYVDITRFRSIKDMHGEESADLAIIDLLLNYREGMTDDEIVLQVKDTFESISKREKMLTIPIIFISKVPSDIIARALRELSKTKSENIRIFFECDPEEILERTMINGFSDYIEINPRIVLLWKPHTKLRANLSKEELEEWKREIREIIKQKL